MYLGRVKKDLPKAVAHADMALKLRPGDRDLLMHLCPLYLQAGMPARVIEEVGKARVAVRRLSVLQKPLAKAYFETGQLSKCWKILTTVRLHNWEGELGHVHLYVDCALALAEQALSRGDAAKARYYVEMADDPRKAPTLGILHDCGGKERIRYWDGLVALHEGRQREAEATWRKLVEEGRRLKRLSLDISEWHLPPNPENDYMRAMCAAALGDARAMRHATGLLERLGKDWVKRNAEAPVDLIAGMVAELRGDYAAAARALRRHIGGQAEKQVARLHLAAVEAGRMRGGPLAVCRR